MPIRTKLPDPSSTETLVMLGRRMRAIREAGKLTQEEISAMLKVDQSTYSKWEHGKRQPELLVMAQFAARCKVTLDFLFTGSTAGVHPHLVGLLRTKCPELLAPETTDTALDTDTALAWYRASIVRELAD